MNVTYQISRTELKQKHKKVPKGVRRGEPRQKRDVELIAAVLKKLTV